MKSKRGICLAVVLLSGGFAVLISSAQAFAQERKPKRKPFGSSLERLK